MDKVNKIIKNDKYLEMEVDIKDDLLKQLPFVTHHQCYREQLPFSSLLSEKMIGQVR